MDAECITTIISSYQSLMGPDNQNHPLGYAPGRDVVYNVPQCVTADIICDLVYVGNTHMVLEFSCDPLCKPCLYARRLANRFHNNNTT